MTRQEFIDALGAKLYEELPTAEVLSQIQYYQGYLDGEIARGKTEEEAVAALGDPNLIAKTILESPRQETPFGGTQSQADAYYEGAYQAENGADTGGTSGGHHEESTSHGHHEESRSYGEQAERGTVETGTRSFMRDSSGEFNWPLFAGILAAVMIFVAVVWIVTKVVIVLGPIILILLAILLVLGTIRGGRRR